MAVRFQVFACVFAGLTAVAAAAQEPVPVPADQARPRVVLALSGGGARGIAHIGALRALEEAGIPVDAIAANSMGSVVGGIFATGRSSAELEEIVRSMDWASLFSGKPDRRLVPVGRRQDRYASTAGVSFDWKHLRLPSGVMAEHRINRYLIEFLSPAGFAAAGDFDRLPVRFRAVAGDLATGEPVVLAKGDLALAVRASLSIPVAFPPVEWEGRKLVDGLIVNNLPIDVAKAFGGSVLVAVDIGTPLLKPEEYESAFGVAYQVSDLLMRRRYRDFSAEADVMVVPDLGTHATTDYSGFDELIRKGYDAMKASLPALRAKMDAAGIGDLARRTPGAAGPSLEGSRIDSVRVDGSTAVSERLSRRTFHMPIGSPYAMDKGLVAFDRADATGLFDRTWMAFAPAGPDVRVALQVKDAPPNRAEVGLGYTEWERARGSIRLRNQNTLGFGEQVELLFAASDAENVARGSLRGDRLLVAGLGYQVAGYMLRDKPRFFNEDGESLGRARFERNGADVSLRVPLKRWGLIELGSSVGQVTIRRSAAVPLDDVTDRVGVLFGQIVIDTLDDLAWPEHGRRIAATGEWSSSRLGADREYWRAGLEFRAGLSFGQRLAAQADGLVGLSRDELPIYNWYRLGGVTLLPGFYHGELQGKQAVAAAVSLRYKVVGQLRIVVRGGAGNVFDEASDINAADLMWGAAVGLFHPSPVGPVSLEFGFRKGSSVASLSIGWN
jgi:NTE family protein